MENNDKKKMKIYIDADDTVLESSQAVIDIINERYSLSPPKGVEDLRCWNYTCIYPGMTAEEVSAIYASEEFFDRVRPDNSFLKVYEKYKSEFEFILVTTGTRENLDKKELWFKREFPFILFVGIEFPPTGNPFDKSIIPMEGGIQIDDRTDALLSTKASCKILLQNGLELPWNRPETGANLYVVQTWEDIDEVLDFTVKYPNWFEEMKEDERVVEIPADADE